jgi:hypothetical protein
MRAQHDRSDVFVSRGSIGSCIANACARAVRRRPGRRVPCPPGRCQTPARALSIQGSSPGEHDRGDVCALRRTGGILYCQCTRGPGCCRPSGAKRLGWAARMRPSCECRRRWAVGGLGRRVVAHRLAGGRRVGRWEWGPCVERASRSSLPPRQSRPRAPEDSKRPARALSIQDSSSVGHGRGGAGAGWRTGGILYCQCTRGPGCCRPSGAKRLGRPVVAHRLIGRSAAARPKPSVRIEPLPDARACILNTGLVTRRAP